MKKLLLICVILLGIIIPGISSNSPSSSFTDTSDVKKEIRLMGSLGESSARSLLQEPIQATVSNTDLDVTFLYNVGIIEVEIYSESGSTVYTTTVDTQTQGGVSIDVTGWDSGIYEIRFVSATGQYMYGIFEID